MTISKVAVEVGKNGTGPLGGAKKQPLKWREKISYGFGDLGNGFMFDLGQSYLTKFFTDVALIPAGFVGMIFGVTKIWDAFMDPLAGTFIDERKVGKRGKFRPVMMISAILLAVFTVVTFTMPNLPLTGKIAYALVAYMLWGTIYSFTNGPYVALANVMTRDVAERSDLATTRQTGSLSAQWIVGVAFIPLVLLFSGNNTQKTMSIFGYDSAAAVMAVLGVLCFAVVYHNCHEHIKINREASRRASTNYKDYVKVVFTNKPLLAVILMTLFTISAMNTNNTMMLYFAEYNLGSVALQPLINAIMIGVSIAAVLSIPFLVRRFGKKPTLVVCLIIGAVADVINFILPTNVVTFIIFVTVGYAALAIPNGITWALVSDIIDYGEWHTGIRKEGITVAVFNLSRKVAQALAAVISTAILGVTGYIANVHQSASTLLGIKGAVTLYPAVALIIAGIIFFFLYGISDDKYVRIAGDLDRGVGENGNRLQSFSASSTGDSVDARDQEMTDTENNDVNQGDDDKPSGMASSK